MNLDTSKGSALWTKAEELYARGPRAYHKFSHAEDVLERVEMVERDIGFMNYEAVRLAALFHDATYVAGNKNNEAVSANQMRNAVYSLKQYNTYVAPADLTWTVSVASDLILSTAEHTSHQHSITVWDTVLLMDCDVLGFAEEWPTFQKNNDDIEFEFVALGNFDSEKYRQGRIKFLMALYDKGIFRSPYFRKAYEEKALINIRAALRELGHVFENDTTKEKS
jgi:predicted metal-dependent HD superfamily phosphohydrolase